MSGNQPIDPPNGPAEFPAIGQYDLIPGPGEEGYVEPEEATFLEFGDEIEVFDDESGDDPGEDEPGADNDDDPDPDDAGPQLVDPSNG